MLTSSLTSEGDGILATIADRAPHTVVTGGSSGIGAAVVTGLLSRGHAVTILDLQEPLEASSAEFAAVDCSDEASLGETIDAVAQRKGTVTGAVICHGIRGEFVSALDLDLDQTRRVLDVHIIGTLAVSRAVVRRLNGLPASIVTISSSTAYGGWENQSDYGVAKAGVRQLTENLAIEWAPLGVRVNGVAPGHTRTPMVQELIDRDGYDVSAAEARMPLGRLGEPEELASAIIYLLCDATFVTGQTLPVDGGWTVVGK